MSKTVEMMVTVTVEPPEGETLSDEKAIELAMSSVTQNHEVAFGRECVPGRYNRMTWAKGYAEVSEDDCKVIE